MFCWDLLIYIASFIDPSSEPYPIDKAFRPFVKSLHWLDKKLFHIGYDPALHGGFPGDNHFGVVFYLTILLLVFTCTIIWTIADRKRLSYDKLFYWFNVYLRYVLAVTIFGYGIDKLIPVQMPYPGTVELLTPLGEQGRFNVLWNFMGVSPGFMIFAGSCEIIGSLLLLYRRTYLFGALFTCTILTNVVAFNWFYNVPVKLFSLQLLLYDIYLVVPYISVLWLFFFRGQPANPGLKSYGLQTKWKKNVLRYNLIIIPLVICIFSTIGVYNRYKEQQEERRRNKIYEVTSFVAGDSLPPLLTDTLRWRRFVQNYKDYVIIYNMQDKTDWYQCDIDSIKKTFTLHDNPNKSTWHLFHYEYPARDQLLLTGKWKGQDVVIRMKSVPLDSMYLNKEKIRLIQE